MSSPRPTGQRFSSELAAALERHRHGDLIGAEAIYRQLLGDDRDAGNAWNLLGVLLHQTGRSGEAADALCQATEKLPGFADAHSNRAMVALDAGQFDLAQRSLERALSIDPAHRSAKALQVRLWQARGRACFAEATAAAFQAAANHFRAALAREPANPELALDLANTLRRLDRMAEALPLYRQAAALASTQVRPRVALATALREAGHWSEALEQFRTATRLDADSADAWQGVGVVLMEIGRADDALPALARAIDRAPASAGFHSTYLGALGYSGATSPERLLHEHRQWAMRHALAPPPPAAGGRPPPWRVGFLSADLRNHPVACFLESWLPHMRGRPFELFFYSDAALEDATSARLQKLADHWQSVRPMDDGQLAAALAADDLDLLIDLSGHTAPNRLPALAGKPARHLWHWIGYPATTGMTQFDGRITDAIADPAPDSERFHCERLLRLPGCFLCYAAPAGAHLPLAGADLPAAAGDSAFVFGSFNNLAKLNARVIAVWSAILAAVQGSRLRLKSRVLEDPAVADEVALRFAAHGIARKRLDLCGFSPALDDHFQAYGAIDLALDPFPYNGTTTTCDALWMGVPVLTLRGDRHAGRVGESVLTGALGADAADWIAADDADYVRRAVDAARAGKRRLSERMALRARVQGSALTDGAAFAERLEALWREHLGKLGIGQERQAHD